MSKTTLALAFLLAAGCVRTSLPAASPKLPATPADQAIDTDGQHRSTEPSPLEFVLDPDRFNKSYLGHRVEPVQGVAGDPAIGRLDRVVERRVVERTLGEALRHAIPVSM